MKRSLFIALFAVTAILLNAQTALKKVYNEDINPIEQIDKALAKAKAENKNVICQVGGNWCPWCLDENGKVIHTQDSSFLEEGNGYNKEKVLRFFNCWTPQATL